VLVICVPIVLLATNCTERLVKLSTDQFNFSAFTSFMSRQTHVPTLLKLFRQFGYEGVSLAKISQATGLGKASLYHYFPKGKAEMATVALAQVNEWLDTKILPILVEPVSLVENHQIRSIDILESMCGEVNNFFNGGKNPCLWAVLMMSESSGELFHNEISRAFRRWIEAISQLLTTAGLESSLAQQRGEDAIIAVQGALILCQGLNDFTVFQRVLAQLPSQLCRDLGS
jgi:TetR/AcrR family transcriptional regulator, lmrAB and yxaGH operons repressor